MSRKRARAGGKYTGSHTTVIPAAALVCDIAEACGVVTKISPGFIKAGLRPVQGKRRLKITQKDSYLLINVRDNTSNQELHIYTTDPERARIKIVESARERGILVSG